MFEEKLSLRVERLSDYLVVAEVGNGALLFTPVETLGTQAAEA